MFSVHTTPEEFENGSFALKTQQMFSVHTTPEEFENGGFTLKIQQMFSVHTTPEEFENGGFTLKMQQMFSVHTTPEEFKKATIRLCNLFSFNFVFQKTRSGKSRDYHDSIVFEKLRFQSVFPRQVENKKPVFSNSFGLKSDFKKLRFRDGLVWTAGLTVEIKLRFKFQRRSISGLDV